MLAIGVDLLSAHLGACELQEDLTPVCIYRKHGTLPIYAGKGAGQGGNDGQFERYDPVNDIWDARNESAGRYGRASAVVDGKLYAIGGEVNRSLVEVYDPVTDSWAPLASVPTPRIAATAAVVDGKIYVMGGADAAITANEVYDPTTDMWEERAPMPRPRASHAAAAIGGKIYVFGGGHPSVPLVSDEVDVYDPSSDSWSTLATPMPRLRFCAGSAVIDGEILLIGGFNPTEGHLAAVDEYNPALDLWRTCEPMPTPRKFLAAAVVDSIVYALAGEDSNGCISPAPVEAYDPTQDETCGPVQVQIDIKPGSDPNSINTKSKGKIPVAILSTADFDAPREVDPTSLTFGRTGDEASLAFCNSSPEDVNSDLLLDLVCHFYTQQTGFQVGDTEGILKGQTTSGTPLMGMDSVCIVK